MKKLIWIVSILLLVVVGYYAFHTEEEIHDAEKAEVSWFKQYPELGKIAKTESPLVNMQKVKYSESQASLRGKITNSLGIRDDILEFIVKSIPESNTLAMRASIRIAQNDQLIYYGGISNSDAMALASSDLLALNCLSIALPDNKWLYIHQQMSNMMRNSSARSVYMSSIDRQYFSWQVITSGMSVADEDQACAAGNF